MRGGDETPLIVAMHELPLESTGGGVLLRELLRHWAERRPTVAVYPVYPHQRDKVEALGPELAAEGIEVVAVPVAPDWGRRSFTLRRLLSPLPGSVVAFHHAGARARIETLAAQIPKATWLLVAPFSAALLPSDISPERVAIYYTNVDEDIVTPLGPGVLRRWEAAVERGRVRRYVMRSALRPSRWAAITQKNADTLTATLRRQVTYVPPLMASRPVDHSRREAGLALITTNYTYPHNRTSLEWFVRDVWPLVDASFRLEVSGLDDGRGALPRLLSSIPRARYLGFLSRADLEAAFARCAVVVNPTRSGSGFQIKMLDAISRGIPLVSTHIANPLEGLVPSADSPSDFARLISAVAADGGRLDYQAFYREAQEKWTAFLKA